MGFEVAAALGALMLAGTALGLSLLHVVRCPVLGRMDELADLVEASERKCKGYVDELEEISDRIGRRNSRLGAERAKLERAAKAREGPEVAASASNGGLTADEARAFDRLLTSADLHE